MNILPKRKFSHGDHSFLAEELLVPMANHCDGGRLNMFTNHISQTLALNEGEPPLIFTNFENEIGKYCSGSSRFDTSDKTYEVIKIIEFHQYRKLVIIKDEDNNYDVVVYNGAINLTESFGYTNKFNEEVKEGTKLSPNDTKWVYHSGMYDDNLNFQYGANLNAIYLAYKGSTYEDSIVISESTAKRLSHNDVNTYEIILNHNDIFLNIYGDDKNYKCFPDIGEEVNERLIASIRRISNTNLISDMRNHNLRKYRHDDAIFIGDGTIYDIQVYSNMDLDADDIPAHLQQVKSIYLNQKRAYSELVEFAKPLKESGCNFSDDLNYQYIRAIEYLDKEKKFQSDTRGGLFEGIYLMFTTVKEVPLLNGSKITNRVGGKGVVGLIEKDENMPTTEDGRRADIILNPLGVIGRKNITQLYEQELNFISETIVIKNSNDHKTMFSEIMKFYGIVSPEMKKFLEDKNFTDEEIDHLCEEFKSKGVPIHQKPFFDTVDHNVLELLYDTFDTPKIKFKGIDEHLIMGKVYYMSLKHLADGKYSVRSSEGSNLVGTPFRSNEKYKQGKVLFNTNPVKLGEQEWFLLTLLNDPSRVNNFIKSHSSSNIARKYMNDILLTKSIDDIERVINDEVAKIPSNSIQVVKAELRSLGIDVIKEN